MLGERVATPTRSTKEATKTVPMRNAHQNPENALTAEVSTPLAIIRHLRAKCAIILRVDRDHRVNLRNEKTERYYVPGEGGRTFRDAGFDG